MNTGRFHKIITLFSIAVLGGIAALGIFKVIEPNQGNEIQRSYQEPATTRFVSSASIPGEPVDFTQAASLTVNAVVHVKTYFAARQNTRAQGVDPFRDFFWGNPGFRMPSPTPQTASGSGVIISDDGFIVTNNHVIDNAEKIEIVLNDRRTFIAKVIGTDPSTDIALLKIKEENLPFVSYGNSDLVKIGEWVLAVGNPFNLTSTVTAGIVSAKARNINILPDQFAIESFIQTDAAVNPGNSGGALVNIRGELIGINTAIASNTGSFAGYSFAVPVNIVRKVVNDLHEFGTVQRAFIGVSIKDIDSKLADELSLKNIKGVYVQGLTKDGAAADAGIKEGDIILRVNNVQVNSSPELQEQIGRHRPGDKVDVLVLRDGKEKNVTLILRNKDGDLSIVKDETINLLGATFENLSNEEKTKLNIDAGVKIKTLGNGKLRNAGIKEGFIITSIDKKEIRSKEELLKFLENKKGGVLIEGIYPNGTRAYYGFGI
jgi:serine protease Do